ncbi:hypothetical protein EVB27_067 [Rhizobium phage RHph_TM16]|nr:hypothetical protein EVB27_067 [Rhizobium phage RHph_TM16]
MSKTVAELRAQCEKAEVHMVLLTEEERFAMLAALKEAQMTALSHHRIQTLGYAITKLTLHEEFPTAG